MSHPFKKIIPYYYYTGFFQLCQYKKATNKSIPSLIMVYYYVKTQNSRLKKDSQTAACLRLFLFFRLFYNIPFSIPFIR